MKIHFTNTELAWLNDRINTLIYIIAKREDDESMRPMLRVAARMRYKFTPNASYVNLTGKERTLVYKITEKHLAGMISVGALDERADMLQSIIDKVSTEDTDDPNRTDARESEHEDASNP